MAYFQYGIFFLLLLSFPFKQSVALSLKREALFEKAIPKEVNLGGKSIESRLSSQWGLVFVEAKINQHGPFRFLLDTGADVNILSYDLINTLNLIPEETQKKLFQTGHKSATINTAFYEIEEVGLGQARFKQVPFVATNTASDDFQLLKDLDVVGILGSNFFHDVILTLDLPHQKIVVSERESFQQHHGKVLKPGNIVNLSHHFYIPVVKMHVQEKNNRNHYDFLVDSGYNGFIKMPICFIEKQNGSNQIVDYDLFKEPGTGFQSELQGSIQIGEKKIDNPLVKYTIGDCREKARWGLIGTRYLQYQTLSIDQTQRVVFLHD